MINVTCAIITNKQEEILVTQRSVNMHLPLKWEFPGGKVENGETPHDCLIREIKEELDIEIAVLERFPSNNHIYNDKAIRLIPFKCEHISGKILLKEHAKYKWLDTSNLLELDWAEADIPIVKYYLKRINVV